MFSSTSYGFSNKSSGLHSLLGSSKKFPPYTCNAPVHRSKGFVTECTISGPSGTTSPSPRDFAPAASTNPFVLFYTRRQNILSSLPEYNPITAHILWLCGFNVILGAQTIFKIVNSFDTYNR